MVDDAYSSACNVIYLRNYHSTQEPYWFNLLFLTLLAVCQKKYYMAEYSVVMYVLPDELFSLQQTLTQTEPYACCTSMCRAFLP